MKITRKRLTEIIQEEIGGILEFSDGSDGPKKGKKGRPAKPGTSSADVEPTRPAANVPTGGTVKEPDASPVPPSNNPGHRNDPSELDVSKVGPARASDEREGDGESSAGAVADDETAQTDGENETGADGDEDDAQQDDDEGDPDPSGAINNDISGQTVQSISVEPDSKVLPGAKEVVLSFNETTDPLHILCTPTGRVCFFWRNQLRDLP